MIGGVAAALGIGRPALIAGAVALAVGLGTGWWLCNTTVGDGLREDLRATELDLRTAQDNAERLKKSLDLQNAAVDALADDCRRVVAAADDRAAAAQALCGPMPDDPMEVGEWAARCLGQ